MKNASNTAKRNASYTAYVAITNVFTGNGTIDIARDSLMTALHAHGWDETVIAILEDEILLRFVGLMSYQRNGEYRISDISRFRKFLNNPESIMMEVHYKTPTAPKAPKEKKSLTKAELMAQIAELQELAEKAE